MPRRGTATVGVGIVLAWRSVVLASQPELVWQNGFESADSCAWTHSEPPTTCDPEMVFVPAGDFSMGSASGSEVETPVHSVSLSAYWIDRWEVTVDAYAECVAASACAAPNETYGTNSACNWDAPTRGAHPVNCVDWAKAQSHCSWSGKRLPTEAEWEKAARGRDMRTYPWGADSPSCAYALMNDPGNGGSGCGIGGTNVVGSRPAGTSPHGALDMAGNVWEWVGDWFGAGYYAESPATNPSGPATGTERVVRGGSWLNTAFSLRATHRGALGPSFWGYSYGFRCARDA